MTISLFSQALGSFIMFRYNVDRDDHKTGFVEDPLVLQAQQPSPTSSSSPGLLYPSILALPILRDAKDAETIDHHSMQAAFYLQLLLSRDYSISSTILVASSSASFMKLIRGFGGLHSRRTRRLYQSDAYISGDDFAVAPGLERSDLLRMHRKYDRSSRKSVKYLTKRRMHTLKGEMDMWTVDNAQVYEAICDSSAPSMDIPLDRSWTSNPLADLLEDLNRLIFHSEALENQPAGSL